jgi:hypothetical protein
MSLNRYAYVNSDPMNGFDRNGLVTSKTGTGGCNDITDPSCGAPCDPSYWPGFDDSTFGCDTGGGGGGGCYGGAGFLGTPDPTCPAEGGGGGGGSDPDPDINCSLSVAQSGTTVNGQDFIKAGIADPPSPGNQLGQYRLTSGWFNAVQIQGVTSGDNNPADWRELQDAVETGSYTVMTATGPVKIPINVHPPEDNPGKPAISTGIVNGSLDIDWLDNPGQSVSVRLPTKNGLAPFQVVHGELNFSFTSTLANKSGKSCSKAWSFTLKF